MTCPCCKTMVPNNHQNLTAQSNKLKGNSICIIIRTHGAHYHISSNTEEHKYKPVSMKQSLEARLSLGICKTIKTLRVKMQVLSYRIFKSAWNSRSRNILTEREGLKLETPYSKSTKVPNVSLFNFSIKILPTQSRWGFSLTINE